MNTQKNRIPNPEQEEARVAEWNTLHPEGTPVRVKLDDGSEVTTTNLTEAWLLGGHTAVIKVCGISGAYKLDRVTAL
jgi:hypothetical protein